MNPAEVVIHEIEGDRVLLVFKLLGKAVRQASEPSHLHTGGGILSLDETSTNVPRIGIPDDWRGRRPDALRRTVSRFALCSVPAVELNKHGIIDLRTESSFDRIQIHAMSVCGQLDAIRKSRGQIRDEVIGVMRRTPTYQPAGGDLGVGAKSCPRPYATVAKPAAKFLWKILLFGVTERPNLTALDSLARQVAERLVLILSTRGADLRKELNDRVFGHPRHAHCGPNGITLDEASNYLGAPFIC